MGFGCSRCHVCIALAILAGCILAGRARPTPPTIGDVYVLGNSIPAGCRFNRDPWPDQLAMLLGRTARVRNLAVEAARISDLAPWHLPEFKRGSIVIAAEATNELFQNPDGAAVFEAYRAWCTSLRRQGFRVVAETIVPRGEPNQPAGFETARRELNARIRAEYPEFADALADVAALPEFQTIDYPSPASIYQDRTHPTDHGANVIAHLYDRTLRTLAARSPRS